MCLYAWSTGGPLSLSFKAARVQLHTTMRTVQVWLSAKHTCFNTCSNETQQAHASHSLISQRYNNQLKRDSYQHQARAHCCLVLDTCAVVCVQLNSPLFLCGAYPGSHCWSADGSV
jgi:hypothetical protein